MHITYLGMYSHLLSPEEIVRFLKSYLTQFFISAGPWYAGNPHEKLMTHILHYSRMVYHAKTHFSPKEQNTEKLSITSSNIINLLIG